MTFKEQLWWSRKWGATLLAVAVVLIGTLLLALDPASPDRRLLPVGHLAQAALAGGFLLLGFGGIMRPAHRWLYLQSRRSLLVFPRITVNERFTRWFDAPFWRWWLHIDPAGNDRDA